MVVAVGEAVVIIARQIDLSVGAILGLSAYMIGAAVGHIGFAGPVVGVSARAGLGAGLGLVNGVLIERVRMPAIIATLATLSIYSGLQVVVTHGSQLLLVPAAALARATCLRLVAGHPRVRLDRRPVRVGRRGRLLRMTRMGRDLYAIGSNPEAAAYLGIPAATADLSGVRPLRRAGGAGRAACSPGATGTSMRPRAPATS